MMSPNTGSGSAQRNNQSRWSHHEQKQKGKRCTWIGKLQFRRHLFSPQFRPKYSKFLCHQTGSMLWSCIQRAYVYNTTDSQGLHVNRYYMSAVILFCFLFVFLFLVSCPASSLNVMPLSVCLVSSWSSELCTENTGPSVAHGRTS